MKTNTLAKQTKQKNIGFTLLEMIIVIIIIAILAVSIAPKFIGVTDFNAYSYRDQMISALRLMQQKAMQDTRESICHRILVNSSGYGEVESENENCVSNSLIADWQTQNTGFSIPAESSATINFSGPLTFDSWGRVEECDSGCSIEFQSDSNAQLCIEAQGYIHAC